MTVKRWDGKIGRHAVRRVVTFRDCETVSLWKATFETCSLRLVTMKASASLRRFKTRFQVRKHAAEIPRSQPRRGRQTGRRSNARGKKNRWMNTWYACSAGPYRFFLSFPREVGALKKYTPSVYATLPSLTGFTSCMTIHCVAAGGGHFSYGK